MPGCGSATTPAGSRCRFARTTRSERSPSSSSALDRPAAEARGLAVLLLALSCAACSGQHVAQSQPLLSPGAVEEPVTAVLTAALNADSRGEPADSLWAG